MKKSPFNVLKFGVVGLTVVGISAGMLPMNGTAFADAVNTTKPAINAPISAVPISTINNTGIQIKEVILTSSTELLNTNIKVPQIVGMLDTKAQEEINSIILSNAQKDLALWEKDATEAAADAKKAGFEYRPYELNIIYDLKENKTDNPSGMISLVVTSQGETGGTGMPRVDTYNVFNTKQAKRIALSDFFGNDFKEKLNAGILAKINEEPENYFIEDFKGIDEEQGFYIENGEVVILFPKYSIAPGAMGTPEFRFSTHITNNPKLDLSTIATFKNANGVSMVSLRDVANRLGYEIKWNQTSRSAELKKGAQWTNVTLGKDSYFFAKMAPVTLGTAPILKNDTIYVPVKMVTDILRVEIKNG
ncbi:hypothetical protein BSK65_08230 [Paenibacillus odorifer]|uniref:Copper amine oxidase n=1 Tax=Paenibacillus odorifer TaxID=189426 RepID=A0A1R0ZKT7_9BACL|nr:stalk domain-containing protein [Paenibacillus odorifer]OME72345.1 hypothetical protein BSK65_08230 [Paenibacillus odorifer]